MSDEWTYDEAVGWYNRNRATAIQLRQIEYQNLDW